MARVTHLLQLDILNVLLAEKWSPFEVAVFEASITLYGKNFSRIQKHVRFCLLIMFFHELALSDFDSQLTYKSMFSGFDKDRPGYN